uniref:modulator of smoothened protein n=1 Tax=Myodes glareolus TaxID=447135 RepID=UPI00201FD879|nr:modulator of smoothened protein [Myodes glareolus]
MVTVAADMLRLSLPRYKQLQTAEDSFRIKCLDYPPRYQQDVSVKEILWEYSRVSRLTKVFHLCIFPGALTVGLVRQCQTIHGRDRTCIPPRLPPEWVTTLFFIIMGIISLTVTCGLLVASHWRREATKYARWIAFTGMILFCMAALIFPIGFYINEVGGQPYKLPNNTVVGSSYVLFVLSIFFTIVGLLFAGKVCLPG